MAIPSQGKREIDIGAQWKWIVNECGSSVCGVITATILSAASTIAWPANNPESGAPLPARILPSGSFAADAPVRAK
jgi:hypothetical protein